MSGLVNYILDVETTGIKAGYHEMTEVGIIRYTDRVQLWKNIKCDFPERASLDALMITKKTMADLNNGLNKYQVIEECEKFFNNDGLTPAHRCIIGHNVSFDKRFLHALWASCNKTFPADLWLDTMALVRHYIKLNGLNEERKKNGMSKLSVNLHASCDLLGIKKISEAHNSKMDSRNTYFLYNHLIEQRNIDYLPFIKNEPHNHQEEEQGLDPSLLDEID